MKMKNIIPVTASREASDMQESIIAKLGWKKAGIVSYNLPLLSTLSSVENIMLPLNYWDKMRRKDAEPIVVDLLEKFGLSFITHYRPKKLNEYEILIVKFLRAIMRRPGHVIFVMPNLMVPSEDYTTFKDFAGSLKDFDVTLIEHQRYLSEYIDTDFKETKYHSWITLASGEKE